MGLLKNARVCDILIKKTQNSLRRVIRVNDKRLDFAVKIQSIAQAGLQYGRDKFDIERYEELCRVSAGMMAERTGEDIGVIKGLFCNESGYQTPKVDTRAAVFSDGKILLVRENNGKWALPGGWCDVDMSVSGNAEKKVLEETGCTVRASGIIAVQDSRRHNVVNYACGVVKIFVQCIYVRGSFHDNIEITEARFFDRESLPDELAVETTTR